MKIIAAMTKDRVIGKNNDLPWHIPEDLKNFRKFTTGNVIVMGRKTYESIGKPLPNRENIVVTSSVDSIPGCHVCKTFEEAIAKANSFGKEVFVIGGSRMFAAALPHADMLYISWVKEDHEGDVHFPPFEKNWQETKRTPFDAFDLVEYTRKESPPRDN